MVAGSGTGDLGLMFGISSHLCPVAPPGRALGVRASRRQEGIQTIPCRRQLCTLDMSPGGGTNWTFPGVQRFLAVLAMENVQAVFLPRWALLWHAAAGAQELSPVQEQDTLPRFQMCVRLIKKRCCGSSWEVHMKGGTGHFNAFALLIPPSKAVRAGISWSSLCRYRTEADMPARNSCLLNHPLEMSLSLNSLWEKWHS